MALVGARSTGKRVFSDHRNKKYPWGMTTDERERMNRLCQRIQDEKNPKIFDELVKELNDLLEVKHGRIHPEHKTQAGGR